MARQILYIWGPLALLFFAGAALILSLSFTSPKDAHFGIFLWVYLSVFTFVFSLFTVLGFHIRNVIWPKGGRAEFFRIATRQGGLLALLSVASLFLQAAGLLSFWTGSLLLVIFLLIELYSQ